MAKVAAILLALVALGSTAPTSSDHPTTSSISTSFERYRYTGKRENAADSAKSDVSSDYREEEDGEMMQGDQPIVSLFDYNGTARQEEQEENGEERRGEARRNRTATLDELLRRQRKEK